MYPGLWILHAAPNPVNAAPAPKNRHHAGFRAATRIFRPNACHTNYARYYELTGNDKQGFRRCNNVRHCNKVTARRNKCSLSPESLAPGKTLFLQWRMPLAMIIVIGWLYVTILVAASEPSLVAGILSFLFYGALPSGLILYFSTSRVRRERRKYREMMAEKARREAAGSMAQTPEE